jgi:transcriptional regulator with XRE-family HTH domain
MQYNGPTIVRRQLGHRLRAAREGAGMTIGDVVTSRIVSKPTLHRYESGRLPVAPGKVLELCRLYGRDQAETDALYELALGSQERGWWEDIEQIAATGFGFFIGLESAASQILTYEPDLVPGLLQTPDYARAVELAFVPAPDEATIERRVGVRLRRQRTTFGRTSPPRMRFVLGAGALARQVGGPDVLAAQLAHLRSVAAGERVELRVLPWEVGAHAASWAGSFTIMRCDDPDDPPVVHVATTVGSSYFELPAQVERYSQVFRSLHDLTIPIEEHRP